MNIEALKKDNGTVLNIDNDALYHFMRRRDFKVDPAELENEVIKHFNERYLNAGLSDILYNIDGCTPCKTREFQGDKYLCKEERGVAVDYSENKKLRAAYDIYAKTDVDAFGIWIELCRKNGKEVVENAKGKPDTPGWMYELQRFGR